MRKILSAILLILSACAYALHVEGVGSTKVYNNGDTIFVFADNPELKTRDNSKVDWYQLDGTLFASNTETIFPNYEGDGYYIEVGGQREYFYVFRYSDYRPRLDSLIVDSLCTSTRLRLVGAIRPMTYTNQYGVQRTLSRTCRISYTDLSWGGEEWTDSLVVLDNQPLHTGEYVFAEPFYRTTDFTLTYEPLMAELGLDLDSISSEEASPVACKAHPTSVTTVRGEAGERTNEVDRPTDASVLTGSAPLDILFRSNPTPAVDFYQWRIYKGSQLLAQRTDEQTRYEFSAPGSYRVVCTVTNALCPCTDPMNADCQPADSTEFTIAVSESMLLVPNAFTPNGDGKNDEFRVQYRSLREFHCWVYNRWGKLVYDWTDPAKGWDGTINGRPAAEGAYFYVIRAFGTDAAKDAGYTNKISYNKKKRNADEAVIGVYQLSGDINLLRGGSK